MIECGAPLDEVRPGTDPLTVAEGREHLRVMGVLADSGKVSTTSAEGALFNAARFGRAETTRVLMQRFRPRVSPLTLSLGNRWRDGRILKVMVEHGADVNAADDGIASADNKGRTAMHLAARDGDFGGVRALGQYGGDVNARDVAGRTPLMILAEMIPGLELAKARREERAKEPVTPERAALLQRIAAQRPPEGDREPPDGMRTAITLLELGADAKATDFNGNDALAHCEWECRREPEKFPEPFAALMRKAGATGAGPAVSLFQALAANDPIAAARAIHSGANVNAVSPAGNVMPLCWCATVEMTQLLLAAGADPTKRAGKSSPVVTAARNGSLEPLKVLIGAIGDNTTGEDAIDPGGKASAELASAELAAAYAAAQSAQRYDVLDYLKSIGVRRPVPPDWKPFKAGVGMWEDFCEILVHAEAATTARAVAAVIKGQAFVNAYDRSFDAGKTSYAVLQPIGMHWSNVQRITPARTRKDGLKSMAAFGKKLAKAANAEVLIAQYSDTSDAVGIERFGPGGATSSDAGWDIPSLEEMLQNLGHSAPAWAAAMLAKMQREGAPSSTDRLEILAKTQRFVVASFAIDSQAGRPIEIVVDGLPKEAFADAAFVTS